MFVFHDNQIKFPATQQTESGEWVLEYPFWSVNEKTGESILIPPSGIGAIDDWIDNPVWTTDYRSGGRVVDLLVSKQGAYASSWLEHDWEYASEMFTRKECDSRLLDNLQMQGAWWFTRNAVWSGVRLGGGGVWSKHDEGTVNKLKQYQLKCGAIFKMP